MDTPTQPRMLSNYQYDLVKRLCAAPSPVGFEQAMTQEVIEPVMESFKPGYWRLKRFKGNGGVVLDTMPMTIKADALTIMLIGHADKIRLQVRSISNDGKIWVNSDSFLPVAILGHRFDLIIEDPEHPDSYRILPDLTAQAVGAIHFASPDVRSGSKGIKAEQIYLETGLYGKNRKQQLIDMGVRPGQPAIFSRRVSRGPTAGTFYGSYLDNALGCFAVIETARRIAAYEKEHGPMKGIRLLFTIATHEEIGIYGSRVAAGVYRPDILIAADVCHDYDAAPGISAKRMQSVAMGEGCAIASGAVHSYPLTAFAHRIAAEHGIAVQRDFSGSFSGTDSMAGALSAIDAASLSVGFPIRNMHTSSELACDSDVLATIDLLEQMLLGIRQANWTAHKLRENRPRVYRSALTNLPTISPDLSDTKNSG